MGWCVEWAYGGWEGLGRGMETRPSGSLHSPSLPPCPGVHSSHSLLRSLRSLGPSWSSLTPPHSLSLPTRPTLTTHSLIHFTRHWLVRSIRSLGSVWVLVGMVRDGGVRVLGPMGIMSYVHFTHSPPSPSAHNVYHFLLLMSLYFKIWES